MKVSACGVCFLLVINIIVSKSCRLLLDTYTGGITVINCIEIFDS